MMKATHQNDGGRKFRRLALGAALVVATVALALPVTASATSQDFFYNGGQGSVSIDKACDLVNHNGSVQLSMLTPLTAPDGMWIHAELWVKQSNVSWASGILMGSTRQLVQTAYTNAPALVGVDPYTINQPKLIYARSFRTGQYYVGRMGRDYHSVYYTFYRGRAYDFAVRYWLAAPSGPWGLQPFLASIDGGQTAAGGAYLNPTHCFV